MFDKMPQRNVVSYSALMAGFYQNGYDYEVGLGRQCHGYVLKCGLVFFQYVKNGVVRMCAKVVDVVGALEVLCSVPGGC